MLRPGATGMRMSGTRSPRISKKLSSRPSRSYSRDGSQRSSWTVSSTRFDERVEAIPNRSLTLITPRPRSSMWWRVSSGHVPIRIDSCRRRTSTVSSATRRWPRTIRSSAHSLLPMPLSPEISTPRPSTSISTAWRMMRSASESSSIDASFAIAVGVDVAVLSSGTRARSASITSSTGGENPPVISTQGKSSVSASRSADTRAITSRLSR